jgi:subtilisin family serine protease
MTDGWASFSNFGSGVDILAPGVNVTSAWWLTDTSTNTISGTSMATPHVCGTAILYLAANPGATPAAVSSALASNATAGVITGVPAGTANRLLYSR